MPYAASLALAIVGVLVVTKALGWMFRRIGLPELLGEVLGGVVLGASALGLLNPRDPIVHALAQAAILVLLFEAGLHTAPSALRRSGRAPVAVATVGVILPFVAGYFVAEWMSATWLEATVVGAALSATSVGVSTRVLSGLGMLESDEGRIVLSAAVIDDVIGLAILASIMALITGDSLTMELILRSLLFPSAFIAGLVLDVKGLNGRVEWITTKLVWVLAPFFAAVAGALLDLRALANGRALGFAVALVAVGVIGKVLAGWAAVGSSGNKMLIGAAMIPRGEMGLIVAQVGLVAGATDRLTYGAIVLAVFATTLLTPSALVGIARRTPVVAT